MAHTWSSLIEGTLSLGQPLWGLLNSNFSAALFGALAGALSAHFIAAKAERDRQLRAEIAGVNNALELTNSISNTFLGLKRQHVNPLLDAYRRSFGEYVAFMAQQHPPPPAPPAVLTILFDLRTLQVPLTPIAELRSTILSRSPNSSHAISLSVTLHQTISTLSEVIQKRNDMVLTLGTLPTEQRADICFGLRQSAGRIDETYPNLITGIWQHTDDAIYFSILLVDVLYAHGRALAKRYGRRAPRVLSVDRSRVPTCLLPNSADYPDFEAQFRPPAKPAENSNRLKAFISRVTTA
jgi:hypothetical protein